MAIQVRIPTILRSYTGGAKTVEAKGDSLAALFDDLDSRHPGLKGRLITEDGALHRFVNVYVNDEDVRFTGALATALSDGDSVTILPAVAGGAVPR
jgi:molybdopterin synthase sulfur carrier subunit